MPQIAPPFALQGADQLSLIRMRNAEIQRQNMLMDLARRAQLAREAAGPAIYGMAGMPGQNQPAPAMPPGVSGPGGGPPQQAPQVPPGVPPGVAGGEGPPQPMPTPAVDPGQMAAQMARPPNQGAQQPAAMQQPGWVMKAARALRAQGVPAKMVMDVLDQMEPVMSSENKQELAMMSAQIRAMEAGTHAYMADIKLSLGERLNEIREQNAQERAQHNRQMEEINRAREQRLRSAAAASGMLHNVQVRYDPSTNLAVGIIGQKKDGSWVNMSYDQLFGGGAGGAGGAGGLPAPFGPITPPSTQQSGGGALTPTPSGGGIANLHTLAHPTAQEKAEKLSDTAIRQELQGLRGKLQLTAADKERMKELEAEQTSRTETLRRRSSAAGAKGTQPGQTPLGSKSNPRPYPKSAAEALDGDYYQTRDGTRRWDAKTQTFVATDG